MNYQELITSGDLELNTIDSENYLKTFNPKASLDYIQATTQEMRDHHAKRFEKCKALQYKDRLRDAALQLDLWEKRLAAVNRAVAQRTACGF